MRASDGRSRSDVRGHGVRREFGFRYNYVDYNGQQHWVLRSDNEFFSSQMTAHLKTVFNNDAGSTAFHNEMQFVLTDIAGLYPAEVEISQVLVSMCFPAAFLECPNPRPRTIMG